MKILQIDKNHPLIVEQLTAKGFVIEEDHTSTYDQILDKIENYEGIIIRSRIPIDANFLSSSSWLPIWIIGPKRPILAILPKPKKEVLN